MKSVSVRELRNSAGEVLEPVAELRPLPRHSASAAELISRRRHLPPGDPAALRADLDALIDPRL